MPLQPQRRFLRRADRRMARCQSGLWGLPLVGLSLAGGSFGVGRAVRDVCCFRRWEIHRTQDLRGRAHTSRCLPPSSALRTSLRHAQDDRQLWSFRLHLLFVFSLAEGLRKPWISNHCRSFFAPQGEKMTYKRREVPYLVILIAQPYSACTISGVTKPSISPAIRNSGISTNSQTLANCANDQRMFCPTVKPLGGDISATPTRMPIAALRIATGSSMMPCGST